MQSELIILSKTQEYEKISGPSAPESLGGLIASLFSPSALTIPVFLYLFFLSLYFIYTYLSILPFDCEWNARLSMRETRKKSPQLISSSAFDAYFESVPVKPWAIPTSPTFNDAVKIMRNRTRLATCMIVEA